MLAMKLDHPIRDVSKLGPVQTPWISICSFSENVKYLPKISQIFPDMGYGGIWRVWVEQMWFSPTKGL